jgi:O-antigen/teichoic acid export membrane protein
MSLAKRSVQSSVYTISASAITTFIQLIRSILLARLIAPEVFGIYTYAASWVMVTRMLPIFGMDSALLHRAPESEGEKALGVHFTLSILFNLVWGILLALFGLILLTPENRWVLWTILATQFVDNITLTSRTLLMRRVIFRRIALLQIITALLGTVSGLWLAWKGYGILGLVSNDIAAALVALLGFLIIKPPWRPRLAWSAHIVRYMLDFGKRTFLASAVGQALDNIDNLWAGRFLGDTALGYYSRAYTFSSYPRRVLASPLNSVASGTYAELKDDPKRLTQAFFRVNALLVRASFFMAGILALVAPEFIRLVIGAKWLPMLDAFRLMLIYTLLDPIRYTISSLFIAVGKPEKVLWARLVQLVVLVIGLFVFGNLWGISGIAVAVTFMMTVGIVIQLWQAHAYVKISLSRLFIVPSIALAASLALAWLAIRIPGVLGSSWRTGAVKSVVFTLIYAAIILLLEWRELPMYINYIKSMLPAKKKIQLVPESDAE